MQDNKFEDRAREETVARMRKRYEKDRKEGKKKFELPAHWLRKYLLRTISWLLLGALIGGILYFVMKEVVILWICIGLGGAPTILVALAHADKTPLRKYSLIEDISTFLQDWRDPNTGTKIFDNYD